jgi:hypothetical protein
LLGAGVRTKGHGASGNTALMCGRVRYVVADSEVTAAPAQPRELV